MQIYWHTILVVTLLLATPYSSVAEIYKYRDANGRLTFVDDKSKIPVEFHDDLSSISEPKAPLITEDRLEEGINSQVDVPASEVVPEVTSKTSAKRQAGKYQTPVIISGNRVLVPVEVAMGNRTVKLSLLLDTGATSTVLHREALGDLDLPSGKRYQARIAGGGSLMSEKIKFRKITVGPFQRQKATAMVIDLQGRKLPFDGMLGMDFLKTHPYQVDFENQVIHWQPLD